MAVKENIIKVTKALSKFHSNDTGDYDKTPLFDKIFKENKREWHHTLVFHLISSNSQKPSSNTCKTVRPWHLS